MRALFAVLVLFVSLLPSACDARPPFERARATVYRIETGVGQCTGTAVGPHTLLTAEHCGVSLPGRLLVGDTLADVQAITFDGTDHVLVRVSMTFKRWSIRGPEPRPGAAVFLIGHPEGLGNTLRRGYYCGWEERSPANGTDPMADLYDIEGGHGDSGAAIFDNDGRIIGVLSGGYVPTEHFRLIVAFPLGFTPEQWRQASR